MQNAIDALVSVTGAYWLCALAAVFVAMMSELAHAPREPGAEPPLTPLRALTLFAVYLAPILLLLHVVGACAAARQSAFLPLAAALIVMALATILGALIAKASAIARPFHAAAPVLALVACAFTIWVTWRHVWTLVDHALQR